MLGLLVLLSRCSAGCLSIEDPQIEVLSLELYDGYIWTVYSRITNLNSFDVEADITWSLYDKYGYTVGE